nr:tRNA (adenosine(37)-N6)-dimethylallyltransferase MiaA [uncultured Flavobacterium sp.]
MKNNLPKIIVILGPTASGKTDLGLVLAKKFNGEIVSADSRQVYKQMNIGTAKPQLENNNQIEILNSVQNDSPVYIVDGIPHHLIDIVNPDQDFSLADFKTMATNCIQDILKRGKLPIVVGGTGLYIWTIVDNLDIPKIKPNIELRLELEKKSLSELVGQLQEIDPESAAVIDLKNSRRVLRALEVAITSGRSFIAQQTKSQPLFNALQIGIDISKEELNTRIEKRVDAQMQEGLLHETEGLVQAGYSWNLPSMSGIGYRQIGYYQQGKMSLPKAIETLKTDTKKYAKRQMTWFKRDKRIQWVKSGNLKIVQEIIEKFLM